VKIRIVFILICLFVLSCPRFVKASHIMGGVISYEYLGRNAANPKQINYKFTMRIYRDQFSNSQLDNVATIGVFMSGVNGVYNKNPISPLIRRTVNITSSRFLEILKPPCLETPPNIGVQEGLYEWTETLNDTNRTYAIVYMRCCRNETINNVTNPGSATSVYYVEISPLAQRLNNSSPAFVNFPPNLFCANTGFTFDHSARDADSDQLVYRFYNGFSAGILNSGQTTQNLSPPPYALLNYRIPTFTFNTPISGNPAVKVDPETGLMTGNPNLTGQFVATVVVEEYRDGELLSRVFRDYQYNVVTCRRTVVSALTSDSTQGREFFVKACENIPVTLDNRSYERSNISDFKWQFVVRNDTLTNTDWHPTLTFRDTGLYKGWLVLNPGQFPCTDTAYVNVSVGGKIVPNFSFKYDTCVAGAVSFKSLATSSLGIKRMIWNYGDNSLDSNKLETSHLYTTSGIKTVNLAVSDRYGCQADTSLSFEWRPAPPILIVEPDNFTGCAPAKVRFKNLSAPLDTTYKIVWDFGDGTTGREISPTHIYTKPDTYTVKLQITSPLNCYKEATFRSWIKVKPVPKADFDWTPQVINNLKPTVSFFDKSSSDVIAWRWFFDNKAYSAQKNPDFMYRDTGVQTVQLFVRNGYGCQDSVFKTLRIEPEVTFFMPNAFSPNDDSVNDVFKGTGFLYGLKSFRMTVWNRWGEAVFNTTDPSVGWNGLKNNGGQPMPSGVYVCEVEYTTPKDERIVKRNYLTLYR
jgi:gliding motility-associated-like protein